MKTTEEVFYEWQKRFSSEQKCMNYLAEVRWPAGFQCQHCGHDHDWYTASQGRYECANCYRQSTVTSGTLFHATKLSLTKWFWAIYWISSDKGGIPALRLSKLIGVSWRCAYRVLRVLRTAMGDRDTLYRLTDIIEFDDALIGGKKPGKRGRGAEGKVSILVACENRNGRPGFLAMEAVNSVNMTNIHDFAARRIKGGQTVRSDALPANNGLAYTLMPPAQTCPEPWNSNLVQRHFDLCLSVFPWADFRTTKGAIKLHVGLNHAGYLPEFVTITDGKSSDITIGRTVNFPKGSIIVIDKGYNDYSWDNQLTDKGMLLVIRLKLNARHRVIDRHSVLKGKGLICDHTIEFTGAQTSKKCPIQLRRIGYKDEVTGKRYTFLTNNFKLSARTIADIYKARWQVELFFKWIKQNLKIKSFIGTSKNAVMTQIWIALCVYLLLAFLKFQSGLARSMQQLLRILHLNLFEKRDLIALLNGDPPRDDGVNVNQLKLI